MVEDSFVYPQGDLPSAVPSDDSSGQESSVADPDDGGESQTDAFGCGEGPWSGGENAGGMGKGTDDGVPETAIPGRAFLSTSWREKYMDFAAQSKWEFEEAVGEAEHGFTVAVVGRAGAGKGSLINTLLIDEPQQQRAFVGDGAGNASEGVFKLNTAAGVVTIRDIPGYDGPHQRRAPTAAAPADGQGTSSDPTADSLGVQEFLQRYNLTSSKLGDADAVLYVIDKRANPSAAEIINTLTKHGKLVVLVFTHSENQQDVLRVSGEGALHGACQRRFKTTISDSMTTRQTSAVVEEMSYMLRQVPAFFVVTRLPDAAEVGAAVYEQLRAENAAALDMPALRAYLDRDLVHRLRLLRHVDLEMQAALRPFHTSRLGLGTRLLTVGGGLAAAAGGALVAGPVGAIAGNFISMTVDNLRAMLEMCDAAGILPSGNGGWHHLLHDVAKDVAAIAVAAGALWTAVVPVFGPVIRGATLDRARRHMAAAVQQLGVAAHRRWIQETIPTPHTLNYADEPVDEGQPGASQPGASQHGP
ncbi:hypothetical protein HXX76_005952 [Chlamydomonas incerta]|uniref:G domain-containing protein n=1 Tax=Chlamydomonas incerta TaxID=51695 RepID=A0A835W4Z1_CHLIN|nr:hypothetical protein HXX76_005952 [Chlamydomonas incerta]|eukprot:KAG2437294.1 hypothetical protein HXX76_005952 [Chlamydomonas incerta]